MGNFHSYRKDYGLIIVGAIIFTASFLWKDLIVDVRETYFPPKSGLTARLLFTIVITFILIIIAVELRDYFGLKPSEVRYPLQFDDQPIDDNSTSN